MGQELTLVIVEVSATLYKADVIEMAIQSGRMTMESLIVLVRKIENYV
jgi:hypothetical protein